MNIPRYFCWTRFGTEAAQTVTQILERKEAERRAANGVFLWGIGNAVGQSIVELLQSAAEPVVLFSAIKSAPKSIDVIPRTVAAWTGARGLRGKPYTLPNQALVTSRFDPASSRRVHYALVCYSEVPLAIGNHGSIQFRALRNLVSKKPLGHSQVTAVVEHSADLLGGAEYTVAMRASLVPPYFIRLYHPITVTEEIRGGTRSFDFSAAREAVAHIGTRTRSDQTELALA
jgi:hypothetical protein